MKGVLLASQHTQKNMFFPPKNLFAVVRQARKIKGTEIEEEVDEAAATRDVTPFFLCQQFSILFRQRIIPFHLNHTHSGGEEE
jgi:hypothetical protein